MNFRITAVFILALAMAGCSKTQASKPVGIAPLTSDEKFMVLNQPQVLQQKSTAANETTEAAALRVKMKALTDTKEYKAWTAANDAAEKARKAVNETKESKEAVVAQAAAEKTEAAKSAIKEGGDQEKAIIALYAARGLNETDNALCYGPAQFVPTPKLTQIPPDVCKGVAENDYEFRAIKK